MVLEQGKSGIMTRILAILGGLLAVVCVSAGATDASRYDIIVKRQPFWNPPPPPKPRVIAKKTVTPARTKSFVDNIRMCGITERDGKITVGFVMSGGRGRSRTQKSYYLAVGETEDEIQVVRADPRQEKALLRKGSEEGWISMSGASPAEKAPTSFADIAARRRVPSPAVRSAAKVPVPKPTTSYRELLKRRQEERARRLKEEQEKKQQEQESQITGEALEKHLSDYNMKLIRAKGKLGPPLPIQLTPEQDDQLVKEGVLPARE